MGRSVDEEGVDCYTIRVEILLISSASRTGKKTAYAKGSSSRLPGRARPRWFIIISDQEHSLVPVHSGPTTSQSSLHSPTIDLRIAEDEVASDQHFGDVQFLVLPTCRECLS